MARGNEAKHARWRELLRQWRASGLSVRAFCAGQLAHYKVPRYVHVTEQFPMTVTGKIRKVEMRELAIEILGLSAAARVKHA